MEENHIQEDEIDLRELFGIIWQKRIFIIIFTSFVTIAAIAFAYIKTPIYEVTSNVQVGHISKELLENPEIIAKNTEMFFLAMDKKNDSKKNIEAGIVDSIKQGKTLKDFITIKTQATTNDLALKRNKEVVEYMQNLYIDKIEQFKTDTKNRIIKIERDLYKIDSLEKKNLERKINIIKTQTIKKIDEEINRLNNQDIKKLEKKIEILQTQEINKINTQIKFIKKNKIPQINAKIKFHQYNLKKYTKNINDIYKQSKNTKDTTLLTVSSLQMTNYQNLILNAQNKIEDLKLEKAKLESHSIKDLEQKINDIITIKIRDIKIQIDNIKKVTIENLIRDRNNIERDNLRKLQYQLNVELPEKKLKMKEEIQKNKFMMSSQNLRNTEVIGDYILTDYPIKPKKKLIVVVAFVTGFILSIFLAFLINFVTGTKKKITHIK